MIDRYLLTSLWDDVPAVANLALIPTVDSEFIG